MKVLLNVNRSTTIKKAQTPQTASFGSQIMFTSNQLKIKFEETG